MATFSRHDESWAWQVAEDAPPPTTDSDNTGMLEVDIHRGGLELLLTNQQLQKPAAPELRSSEPQPASPSAPSAPAEPEPPSPSGSSPERVVRDAVDLARLRRRRERLLEAQWEAGAKARAELAPVLAAMSVRVPVSWPGVAGGVPPAGTRIWVKGLGKGTYIRHGVECHSSIVAFDAPDRAIGDRPRRRTVYLHRCRWAVLPPRQHEAALRRARCPSLMPRLAAQHERDLLDDPQEAGSACAGRMRKHTARGLSRRAALADRADGARRALDPLAALSQRSSIRAREKQGWRSRKMERYHVDSQWLAFPIPSADVADAVEAAGRRAKARNDAADAAWAAAEQANASTKRRGRDSAETKPERPTDSFDQLRSAILTEHRSQLEAELGASTVFKPFPLGAGPATAFLRTYAAAVAAASAESDHDDAAKLLPTPAYHGTRSVNFASIARHGLVVPNSGGHGVRVQNGSAHGVGIYTARLGNHGLSLGFSDTNELLICGVVDDGLDSRELLKQQRKKKPRRGAGRSRGHRVTSRPGQQHGAAAAAFPAAGQQKMGRLRVHRDVPGKVRHVGSAMVIFQGERVAPLFKVAPSRGWAARMNPALAATTNIDWMWAKGGNPNETKASVSGSQHTRQLVVDSEVLFLPPGPVEWCGSRMKHVKRRQVAKARDVARRRDRTIKRALLASEV